MGHTADKIRKDTSTFYVARGVRRAAEDAFQRGRNKAVSGQDLTLEDVEREGVFFDAFEAGYESIIELG